MAIDKVGIIADEKERGFRLILRGSQTTRQILESPASGYVIVESHRRTDRLGTTQLTRIL